MRGETETDFSVYVGRRSISGYRAGYTHVVCVFVCVCACSRRCLFETVFRFELTPDYGLRYPLGHFRMVIRTYPKGYCLHIYLHRFAVVLSTIQISVVIGWWLLQQRRRAASTLTCLHLHLGLHLRLRLHKKNQHNQSTASHQPPPSPQPPG